MVIQCNSCGQRYNLDESKIPGRGARVTCPSCKVKFVVMKPGDEGAPADGGGNGGGTVVSGAPPIPSFTQPGGIPPTHPGTGGIGIRSWQVRVSSGLVYDFTDVSTLKTWLVEGKVTLNDQISADGKNWVPLANIPNLEEYFAASHAPQPPVAPPAAAPPAGDAPQATQVSQVPPVAAPANPLSAAFMGSNDPFAQFNVGGSGSAPAPQPAAPPAAPPAPTQPPPQAPMATAPPPAAAPSGDPFAGSAPVGNPFGMPASGPSGPPSAEELGVDPFGAPAPTAPPPGKVDGAVGSASPSAPTFDPAEFFGDENEGTPTVTSGDPRLDSPTGRSSTTMESPTGITSVQGSNPFAVPGEVRVPLDEPRQPATAPPGPRPSPRRISPQKRRARRGGGRFLVLLLLLVVVAGAATGGYLYREPILALLPKVLPNRGTPTPPPRRVVVDLRGASRARYLEGRRLSRMAEPEALALATQRYEETVFGAENNPLAIAGQLETLSMQRLLGATVSDERLQVADAAATQAWRDSSSAVETNRARAAYYLVSGDAAQAETFLAAALQADPDNAETLALRGILRMQTDDTRGQGITDLTTATEHDADLTWAHQLLVDAVKGRQARRTRNRLNRLRREDAKALAAIQAQTWKPTPAEEALFLKAPPAATPTATVVASAPPPPSATPTATQAAATPTMSATPTAATQTPRPVFTLPVTQPPTATPTPVEAASPTGSAAPTATPVDTESAPTPTAEAETPTPASTPTGEPLAATAEDHFIAGRTLLQNGAAQEAVAELQAAVNLDANNPDYHSELGWAYFKLGNARLAQSELDRAVQLNRMLPVPHKRLGVLFEQQHRYADACVEYDNYARLAPSAADVAQIQAKLARLQCQ